MLHSTERLLDLLTLSPLAREALETAIDLERTAAVAEYLRDEVDQMSPSQLDELLDGGADLPDLSAELL